MVVMEEGILTGSLDTMSVYMTDENNFLWLNIIH